MALFESYERRIDKINAVLNLSLIHIYAGTGKSSSIKAILNQYYDQGLRMIEVYKLSLIHI